MLNRILFKQIDNSSLVVFRIIFGFLCFMESAGAITTGWVKRVLIDPEFTFSFIGFEWLQPLPGYGMYFYYGIMGLFGLMIMVGYKYRFSIIGFAILWAGCYLMQKSSYNNHYYLLMLLSAIMVFLPAHQYASLDSRFNPEIKSYHMPNWCKLVFVLQLLIVYTYASIAKLYPDWLDGNAIGLILKGKRDYAIIGDILQQKWVHYMLAYGGILFDGLVIPLLLFKPTRKWIFFISIFFHLFNSIVFQIGIFPYLSLAFTLFFFEPKTIQKLFLWKKPIYTLGEVIVPKYKNVLIGVFSIYFVIQIALPLRHHFFKDDVLWTEEGHRLSWRMMLRTRSARATYKVVDKKTNKAMIVDMDNFLTKKQQGKASSSPDFIWQFSQRLKKHYKENGQDISVFVDAKVSVNGNGFKPLTNPNVDIANVKWQPLKHSFWVLPSNVED